MKKLLLAALCVLTLVRPAAAAPASVVGTWTVNVTLDSGPIPPATLTLKDEGAKLVGVFSGQQGDMPVEATLKDQAVTVWFTVPTQNGPIAVTMNGVVDGDAMKGSADLGGTGKAEWTARRGAAPAASAPASSAPASSVDVSGTWAVAVETSAGSGSPTFVFKQDGEQLTGHYSGQLGEAPVTGTIHGSAIAFAVDLDVQGTAMHIAYAGTVDGGSMRGAVKLGDLAAGTFTGKKH